MNVSIQYFLVPIAPVFCLFVGALSLVTLECVRGRIPIVAKLTVAVLSVVASVLTAVWLWKMGGLPSPAAEILQAHSWLAEFWSSYQLAPYTLTMYLALGVFTLFSIFFATSHFQDVDVLSEILILLLFVAGGMMLLVSAASLLMIFMALELLSLPTYVLVGIFRKSRASCEAALKYFLFGSFASVLVVLGIAFLYAQFGTFHLAQIASIVQSGSANSLALAGLALLVISIGFKVGMVPFHMWIPDVYQGAPSPITGFMGSAVKLAGFGLATRVLWGMFLPLAPHWVPVLDVLAIATMFLGNLAALAQTNLKRMFAYSSVSHAGYLFLGVAALPTHAAGMNALYYYLVVYGLMFLGLFGVIALVENETGSAEIDDVAGLGFTHPVLAVCLGLFVLSGAGIPPTAGFFAKYFVFLSAVRAGKTPLVILAVLSSLVGVYYYLRVIVYTYMKESSREATYGGRARAAFVCILACAASMLYFSIVPELLW